MGIRSGAYQTNYKGLKSFVPGVHHFSRIKKGQTIGYTDQIHWELTSASQTIDRLCPMNYFDPVSRAMISKVWENQSPDAFSGIKRKYPKICYGIFENKED